MSRCEDCDEVTCACQDRYPDTPARIHDEAAYNALWADIDERAERKHVERKAVAYSQPSPGFLMKRQAS